MQAEQKTKLGLGWKVMAGLAVLTALEFWVASVALGPIPFLAAFACLKAALILYYFMHVSHLWSQDH